MIRIAVKLRESKCVTGARWNKLALFFCLVTPHAQHALIHTGGKQGCNTARPIASSVWPESRFFPPFPRAGTM